MQKKRDLFIENYCKQNNIKLIEISYLDNIELELKQNLIYEQKS